MKSLSRVVLFVTLPAAFLGGLFFLSPTAHALTASVSHSPTSPATGEQVTFTAVGDASSGFGAGQYTSCIEKLRVRLDEDNNGSYEFSVDYYPSGCPSTFEKKVIRSYPVPTTVKYQALVWEIDNPSLSVSDTGTVLIQKKNNPVLVVDPSSLDFGKVEVQKSSTLSVKVKNSGGGTINGSVGAVQKPFSCKSGCGNYMLPGGAEKTVSFIFEPTAAGGSSTSVSFTGNDSAMTKTLSLSGEGTSTKFIVTPAILDFGDVEVNQSKTLSLTVKNTGASTVNVEVIQPGTPFSCDAGCSLTVPPNTEETTSISFKPTSVGSSSATLKVLGGAMSKDISLKGNGAGVVPKLSVSPDPLVFPDTELNKTSGPLTVTVENTGKVTVKGQEIAPDAPFSCESQCTPTIAPGAKVTISFAFKPTQAGDFSKVVSVTDSSLNFTKTFTLSGKGIGVPPKPPKIEVTPLTFDFGTLPIGITSEPKKFTVKNVGSAGAGSLSGIATMQTVGSLVFKCTVCGYSDIALGKTAEISFTFTPDGPGNFERKFNFSNSSVANDFATVTLKGAGVAGVVSVTPADEVFNFGDWGVGQSSVKTLTVTNTIKDELQVSASLVADLPGEEQAFAVKAEILSEGGFSVDPQNFALPPATSALISISFTPQDVKTYTSSLTFGLKSGTKTYPSFSKTLTGTGKAQPGPIVVPPPPPPPPPPVGIPGDLCIGPGFDNKQGGQDALSFIEYGRFFGALDPATEQDKIDKINQMLAAPPSKSVRGLVVCGRSCDDPTTEVNEAALCTINHIFFLAQTVINNMLFIWMPLILAIIIVGAGFMLMTSVGNPEKRKNAFRMIRWAALGYGFMLSSWVMINGVLALLGIHANFSDWWKNLPGI